MGCGGCSMGKGVLTHAMQTGGPEFGSPVSMWKARHDRTLQVAPRLTSWLSGIGTYWLLALIRPVKMISSRSSQRACLSEKRQQALEQVTHHAPPISIHAHRLAQLHTRCTYKHMLYMHTQRMYRIVLYNVGPQNSFLWASRCGSFILWCYHPDWDSLAFPCTLIVHQFLAQPHINLFLDSLFCFIDLVV